MKRILAVAVLVLAAGAGWFALKPGSSGPKPAEWKEAKVGRGDLRLTVQATALVQPQNRLEIKPPIAGRVEEVLAREGDEVKKGQILAWVSSIERAALLDAARAKGEESLKHWEEIYKPAPLTAPLDGTIIDRRVEPGQTLTSEDAVFVLSDRLIVLAQVDETDIGSVRLGQPVSVTLDAYPDEEIEAKVDHIAFEAKTVNNVTIYEVDVLPARVPEVMRSGMTSNVSFVTEERVGVLTVPSEAVNRERGKSSVMTGRPSKPEEKQVETGLSDGKMTEVISGLSEGETVLIRPRKGLAPRKDLKNPFQPDFRRRN